MKFQLDLIVFVLMSSHVWAIKPDIGFKLKSESGKESPQGNVIIEHYENSGLYQEWLSDKANRDNRVLLFQHEHNVNIIFSPDESKLIINNCTGSTETKVHLFKKQDGLHYREITKPDLNILLWTYFMQVNKPDVIQNLKPKHYWEIIPFDHADIECLNWSADCNEWT
jgi:hypothetical protein